jgi:hypothetical protein
MKFTQEQIIKVHKMYEHYCKVMDVKRPVLTFSRQEQKLAVGDRYDDVISTVMAHNTKKAKQLNKRYYDRTENVFGQTDYKRNGYNDVVYLALDQFTEIEGLHHYSEPKKKIVKKTQYIISKGKRLKGYTYVTYITKHKIGHLEETLIHELVHIKYKGMRHGIMFNSIVKRIYQDQGFRE